MGAIFTNFAAGTITDSPLTNISQTINSANFASLPVVATPDYLYLVLDPLSTAGAPEIVQVTAHTLGATSVTVFRGQQVSQGAGAGRQHAGGTVWVQALTALDLNAFPYRIVTAKGDMIGGTGPTAVARVPVGLDQSFLKADSNVTAGFRWGNAGTLPIFSTTAARDASIPTPTPGQGYYLKSNDVNEGLYFNDSAGTVAPGIYRPPWNLPWGYIGATNITADQTGIAASTTDLTNGAVTWTAVANRRYLLTARMMCLQNTIGITPILRIRDGSNTTLAFSELTINATCVGVIFAQAIVTPSAGTYTAKMSASTPGGTLDVLGSNASSCGLIVQDIGPSGAPS